MMRWTNAFTLKKEGDPPSAADRRETPPSAASGAFSKDVSIVRNLQQHAARQKEITICKLQPNNSTRRWQRSPSQI